ncbi:MAG: S41 family peptidase [Cyanobacteria bacterium P01_E01_bin.45]
MKGQKLLTLLGSGLLLFAGVGAAEVESAAIADNARDNITQDRIAQDSIAQDPLPVVPIPSSPGDTLPPSVSPSSPTPSNSNILPPATDLRQVVDLFVVEAYGVDESNLPHFQPLRTELAARPSVPGQPQQREYRFIQEVIARYGTTGDRLLEPAEFNQLLNRPRPPVPSQILSPGLVYVAAPELTPSTARQIRQVLMTNDYSNGVVLDLRGSVGYDPQVVADIARLFLPQDVAPIVTSTRRTGDRIEWNSRKQPLAADLPLLVFIDNQTRQGASMLAAILANGRYTTLAGQPTQGTELQTQFFVLPSEAAVELAIARWHPGALGDTADVESAAAQGVIPARPLNPGQDWLAQVPNLLPTQATERRTPTISIPDEQVGRFTLGTDLGNPGTGNLGIVDSISGRSGENVIRPNSDLKLYYLEDYVVFGYRNRNTLRSFFADRIYMNAPETFTAEGIGIGDTYQQVIATYGPPGENGYNEVNPFPASSRTSQDANLYFINYDALGIAFAFQSGTNQVRAIGLFKPGS